MSRPYAGGAVKVWTDERIAEAKRALSESRTLREAAERLGVSASSLQTVFSTRRAELLLHEILHACIASSGLGVTQRWTDAREEVVVRGLAGPLAHALVSGGLWRGRRVPR